MKPGTMAGYYRPQLAESNQSGVRLMPYPHHTHSIDRWDDASGSNLYEHLAGVNDLLLARATFDAAVKRWPGAKLTLRNGARIIEKTWPADN
jgi:hypothetical protein